MIPYLPEGPPPLDEDEDAGSPMDAPIGLQGILQGISSSTGVPFGELNSTFSSPAQSEHRIPSEAIEKSVKSPDAFEANFDDFQSAVAASDNSGQSGNFDKHESLEMEHSASNTEAASIQPENKEEVAPVVEEFAAFQSNTDISETRNPQSPILVPDSDKMDADGDSCCEDVVDDSEKFESFQNASPNVDGELDSQSFEAKFDDNQDTTNRDEVQDPETKSNTEKPSDNGWDKSETNSGDEGFEAFQSVSQPADSDWFQSDAKVDVAGDCNGEFAAFTSANPVSDGESNSFATFQSVAKSEDGNWNESAEKDIFEGCDEEDDEEGGFNFDNDRVIKTPDNELEDDDFGDFNSTLVESEAGQSNSDFGAFENHAEDDDGDFGDFGDFSQPQGWQESSPTDDDNEFGNFETTNDTTRSTSENTNSSQGGYLETILANMESVLKACFESSEHIADETFPLDSLDVEDKENADKEGVWTFLTDFDKAYALKYQVGKSVGNDWFLKSLNIDSRNVLKNPKKATLPIFASQLGLLEPTRGLAENLKDGIAEATLGPNDNDPTIPAPQFDWNSSGLTNPLDSTNSNFYLDLDFFEATQLKSAAASGHIKSELEEQFLCKELTNSGNEVTTEVKLDPVQSILTQATRGASVSSNPTKNCAELSSAAQALVDSLSDLSYMKARVLMFPVGHS